MEKSPFAIAREWKRTRVLLPFKKNGKGQGVLLPFKKNGKGQGVLLV
jgi:hypothetical protein